MSTRKPHSTGFMIAMIISIVVLICTLVGLIGLLIELHYMGW